MCSSMHKGQFMATKITDDKDDCQDAGNGVQRE